jgi:MFS family permease
MLTCSAILSAIGLYALSFAYNFTTAIAAATIYGLGIVYFWPTMLGVTAERFPRGGAFLLGLMGCVGNIAVGVGQPAMGRINDTITVAAIPAEIRAKVYVNDVIDEAKVKELPEAERAIVATAQRDGAKWSFRYVTILPVILIVIFGMIAAYDFKSGGYKAEHLPSAEAEEASLASDY